MTLSDDLSIKSAIANKAIMTWTSKGIISLPIEMSSRDISEAAFSRTNISVACASIQE